MRIGSDGELLEQLALEIRLNDPRSVSFAGSCIGLKNSQRIATPRKPPPVSVSVEFIATLHEPALSFFAQPLAPAAQGRA